MRGKWITALCLLVSFAMAEKRIVRVGAVSMEKTLNFRQPLDVKIREVMPLIKKSGAAGLALDLLVLPEYLFRGRNHESGAQKLSNSVLLDSMKAAAAANRINIIFQLVEKEGERFYNTALVVNRQGRLAGKYRKVNLPPEEHWATPGDSLSVFNLDFGRVGVLICWDFWFTEPAKKLVEKGAELLVVPTWCNIKQNLKINNAQNGVPILFSVLRSTTCTEGGHQDVHSSVYDPLGRPVSTVHAVGESRIAVAEVRLGAVKNLARGKAVKTGAPGLSGFPARNVVDGLYNTERDAPAGSQTAWKARPLPQWIEIDLGSRHTLRRLSLALFGGENYRFRIEGSGDGEHYTQLADTLSRYETFIEHGIAGAEIYSVLLPVAREGYRYVRVTVNSATRREITINEILIFGDP